MDIAEGQMWRCEIKAFRNTEDAMTVTPLNGDNQSPLIFTHLFFRQNFKKTGEKDRYYARIKIIEIKQCSALVQFNQHEACYIGLPILQQLLTHATLIDPDEKTPA